MRLPAVQSRQLTIVEQKKMSVEFRKMRIEDGSHLPFSRQNLFISGEISIKIIAGRQTKQIGRILRNQHFIGRCFRLIIRNLSGHYLVLQKSPVEIVGQAFEYHRLHFVLGFQHARFGGISLNMTNIGNILQDRGQSIRALDGHHFVRIIGMIVRHLNMRTQAHHIGFHLMFEPDDDTHGCNHHRQTDRHTNQRDTHRRTRHLFVLLRLKEQTASNMIFERCHP